MPAAVPRANTVERGPDFDEARGTAPRARWIERKSPGFAGGLGRVELARGETLGNSATRTRVALKCVNMAPGFFAPARLVAR